jgi:hypothetical protein
MLKKLVAISLVLLLSMQVSRELLTGIWYWLNETEITAQFCVNKEKPALMCNGKCHLKKTLEASRDTSPVPLGLPLHEDRQEFFALPVSFSVVPFFSNQNKCRNSWHYRFYYGYSPAFFVFHPPMEV